MPKGVVASVEYSLDRESYDDRLARRVCACGDGRHTRNLPTDRIIGGPVFRNPDADCLLQVAGLVAHALLWEDEPGSGVDSREGA